VSSIRGNTWHGVAQNRTQADRWCLIISLSFVLALGGGGDTLPREGRDEGREQQGSTRYLVAAVW